MSHNLLCLRSQRDFFLASAALLHVGEDICHRIPVMEAWGFSVVRAECSAYGFREAYSGDRPFSIVTFHNDLEPPPTAAVDQARSLGSVPLVLFENPSVSSEEHDFDVIIAAHTPPEIWLQALQRTMEEARRICERSRMLRAECEEVRAKSQELRSINARNRMVASVSANLWSRDPGVKE